MPDGIVHASLLTPVTLPNSPFTKGKMAQAVAQSFILTGKSQQLHLAPVV